MQESLPEPQQGGGADGLLHDQQNTTVLWSSSAEGHQDYIWPLALLGIKLKYTRHPFLIPEPAPFSQAIFPFLFNEKMLALFHAMSIHHFIKDEFKF